MDVRAIEVVLSEVGKAFRLCRMYPASHPAVQQALSELSNALPGLTTSGAVELRIGPAGLQLGTSPIAARNPQIQELASLLFTQGYRTLTIQPGLTADEVAALIRAVGGPTRSAQAVGAQAAALPALPHLTLEKTVRTSSAGDAARDALDAGPVLSARSTGVFRPDALPPEIEARRLTGMAELAAPEEAPRMLRRLGELAVELTVARDFEALAEVVRVLGSAARRPEPDVVRAARLTLDRLPETTVTALVSHLGDPHVHADERDRIAHALGGLGSRPIPLAVDAYIVSGDPVHRDVLLTVICRVGAAALPAILQRLDAAPRGDIAQAFALLLGATGSPAAADALAQLAGHNDPQARATAVRELAKIGGAEASRVLVVSLRDGNPAVRIAAASAIGWYGESGVAPVLMARLEEEADADAMIAMITAIGELRELRAVPLLIDVARGVSGIFQRHPPRVRAAALRALRAMDTADARLALETYRRHPIAELRAAVEDFRP